MIITIGWNYVHLSWYPRSLNKKGGGRFRGKALVKRNVLRCFLNMDRDKT